MLTLIENTMKTAIKLVLIYLGLQLVCAGLISLVTTLYVMMTHGDATQMVGMALAPSMVLAMLCMFLYLWKAHYLPQDKETWSCVSPLFLVLALLMGLSATLLIDFILSFLPKLPDLMEAQFDVLQSGWMGILGIAILGPVLEELLFRGGVTRVLLARYSPGKAIFLSALIFGIFHINPAQVVSAFLAGLLFAWIYYRTRSLVPCILMHILNNSLAVALNLRYPEADSIKEIVGAGTYYVLGAVSVVVFTVCYLKIKQYKYSR